MEEMKLVDVTQTEEVGQVQIADDVIAVIAQIAALEVDGVAAIGPSKQDFVQALRTKKASKGIKVEVGDAEVFIDVELVVDYNTKIQEVCFNVQEKVKTSIETMTGLSVQAVDIHVIGVKLDKAALAAE